MWQSPYSSHYPQWQTARANVMANLTSLNKLPNKRIFVSAENGSVEILELVALFLLKTGTCTAVQYRKCSPTVNDPETANDPQNGPQMTSTAGWSPKSTANDPGRENLKNGMDFMVLITKKGLIITKKPFLSPSKEKGKENATSQANLNKAKKKE